MNEYPKSIVRPGTLPVPLGLLACLLVWACQGCAPSDPAASAGQGSTVAAASPVVQVTGDRAEFDLGAVKPGSPHSVIFAIRNDSDKPVKIAKVRRDCSCISSAGAPESIAPGQVGRVVAVFDAPARDEPYGSELIVVTDDPARKIIRLQLRARVH